MDAELPLRCPGVQLGDIGRVGGRSWQCHCTYQYCPKYICGKCEPENLYLSLKKKRKKLV